MNNYYQLDFTKLKIAGYFRKSSEAEDKQALSIESQMLEDKRKLSSYKIDDYTETYDESKSAKEQGARLEFLRMEKDILSGKVDSISCWKLDRLARNMIEGGKIIDWLSKGILKCIITNEKVWYPHDNVLAMAVEFGQGKQYLKDLSTNVKRGNRTKAEKGIPNGVAFIGYKNTTKESGEKTWTVDLLQYEKVKILIDEFLKGVYSGNGIAKYAREVLKLSTPINKRKGGKLIHQSGIHRILNNPLLCGKFIMQGKEYELINSLPRYCTQTQFYKIQKMLRGKNIPKEQKHEALFSQILKSQDGGTLSLDPKFQLICDCKEKFNHLHKDRCPACEREIPKMENPKFLEYYYYYNVQRKKNKLPIKTIREDKILSTLETEVLEGICLDEKLLSWAKKYIHLLKVEELKVKEEVSLSLNKKITDLQNDKIRVKKLLISGTFTEDEYKEENKRIEAELNEIEIKKEGSKDWDQRLNEILDIGQTWNEVFTTGDITKKRDTLNRLGTNLTWDEEKLIIHNDIWLNTFISEVKSLKQNKEKYEPKINPYVSKLFQEKIASFEGYHSHMLSIVDSVRTLYHNNLS